MARKKTHVPLEVLLNGRLVGKLSKAATGAVEFRYEQAWLQLENAFPISLSLPLRAASHTGSQVAAVFDNLLPDSEKILKRVAEKVGAESTDAYGLLSKIGRDCVGALQFVPEGEQLDVHSQLDGEPITDDEIERLLNALEKAPLGLDPDDQFRISVAGAQEKTALLKLDGKWLKPVGMTPTTHILKPQIGEIHTSTGTIDLTASVENEFYCLKLLEAFGLPVANAEIAQFGSRKALVVERFDRRWTRDKRLIRLPQEDCCQALSVPPSQKYQNQGGPNIVKIAGLLNGSDTREADLYAFFKSQILFWLIGATDGHAKNFSIALGTRANYRMTPFYDVLTAQPSFDDKQIPHKSFRLAMSVGKSRKYKILEIHGRHFVETAVEAGIAPRMTQKIMDDIANEAESAIASVSRILPKAAQFIHESVASAILQRLPLLG